MQPTRYERSEDGSVLPFVVWRWDRPHQVASSAVLGGGVGERNWIINATVARGYDRSDPEAHLGDLAAMAHLEGVGAGLMTAVIVDDLVSRSDEGVTVWATVGVETPQWAALAGAGVAGPGVGTINLVIEIPVRLSDAALVNAVATATEAKAQAMIEGGLAGTGTPTDAVCVCCPTDGPIEAYGGPRSMWGARIARAAHAAVAAGLADGGDRT
jgi:adenosylcobinamide amidohydrolase